MTAPGAKPFSLKKLLYSKKDAKVSLGAVYALVTETLKCTTSHLRGSHLGPLFYDRNCISWVQL
jgi:hypothetical protein